MVGYILKVELLLLVGGGGGGGDAGLVWLVPVCLGRGFVVGKLKWLFRSNGCSRGLETHVLRVRDKGRL